MGLYNINAGYGKQSQAIPFTGCGKVFAVGDTSTINLRMMQDIFGPDAEGVIRWHAGVQTAIDQVTANAGDRVYIMPGHTETIDSTGDVLLNKAGLTIEGIGQGDQTPLLQITSTSGKIQITKGDTTLKNVRIQPGAGSSGGVIGIELLSTEAAHNITLDSVIWGPRSSQAANFDTMVKLGTNSSGSNYFDGLTIKNNIFEYYTTSITGTGYGINIVTNAINDFKFTGNRGAMYSSAGMLHSSGTSYGMDISNNQLHNQSSAAYTLFLEGTAIHGIAANNLISSKSTGAYTTIVDMGALGVVETFVVNASAADKCGRLPTATIT